MKARARSFFTRRLLLATAVFTAALALSTLLDPTEPPVASWGAYLLAGYVLSLILLSVAKVCYLVGVRAVGRVRATLAG